MTGPVHIHNSVDSVNRSTGWKVRAFDEIHVLQSINLGRIVESNLTVLLNHSLDVEPNRGSYLVEVVRGNLSRHSDSNSVTAIQQ